MCAVLRWERGPQRKNRLYLRSNHIGEKRKAGNPLNGPRLLVRQFGFIGSIIIRIIVRPGKKFEAILYQGVDISQQAFS